MHHFRPALTSPGAVYIPDSAAKSRLDLESPRALDLILGTARATNFVFINRI
jgi:hypothetical protein